MVTTLTVPDARSVRDSCLQTGLRARDNPFRVERVHTFRFRPLGLGWDEILDRLHGMQFRGAVVGPEGSGKSTFLEDLRNRLNAAGHTTLWLQLRRDTRRQARTLVREMLARSTPQDLLLIDGAEQIGPLTWRRLALRTRHQAGLIITVHQPGRLPSLLECATSLPLLVAMVCELAPEYLDLLTPSLPRLFAQHEGNLRLCIREIYDWLASGTPPDQPRGASPGSPQRRLNQTV